MVYWNLFKGLRNFKKDRRFLSKKKQKETSLKSSKPYNIFLFLIFDIVKEELYIYFINVISDFVKYIIIGNIMEFFNLQCKALNLKNQPLIM